MLLAAPEFDSFLDMEESIMDGFVAIDDEGMEVDVEACLTFKQAGLMTSDQGLVVRLADGSEFQIIVVRSK